MSLCPCCSESDYENCCGRFLSGQGTPSTPEELMRSRYTAYATGNLDYIAKTMKPPASLDFDISSAKGWEQKIQWTKLEIIKSYFKDDKGFVEFQAHFIEDNQEQMLHELSEFHHENNAWYYVDAHHPQQPFRNSAVTGRNEPCPCGSGKKFKKCCSK